MAAIYCMIGISLLMALGFLAAFFWSMRTGQQDDLYSPALRMLPDDTLPDRDDANVTTLVTDHSPTTAL